jgi:hypothetical protein
MKSTGVGYLTLDDGASVLVAIVSENKTTCRVRLARADDPVFDLPDGRRLIGFAPVRVERARVRRVGLGAVLTDTPR